ncbi:MAG: hypothetical protein R2911_05930 [Caldilineaceae bacterium]
METLRGAVEQLGLDEVLAFDTAQTAAMQIDGEVRSGVETVHVIGHLPAVEAQNLGGQMIVVMAQYDAPPPAPAGALYPPPMTTPAGWPSCWRSSAPCKRPAIARIKRSSLWPTAARAAKGRLPLIRPMWTSF